jgi:hypothetical protein
MACLFHLLLNAFVTVEFAIDNNPRSAVFACDRLISPRQVDDAEPCMPYNRATRPPNPIQCRCPSGPRW